MPQRVSIARPTNKPGKPQKDFPLFAHNCGQWAKKVRGKVHYFGVWDDPEAALANYLDTKDDLIAGREPVKARAVTVRELVNHFLTSKRRLVTTGEVGERTWQFYKAVCEKVLEVFGRSREIHTLTAC